MTHPAIRALIYLALVAALVACSPRQRELPPACTLEVASDAEGRLTLAFLIVNPGPKAERGTYNHPLTEFGLQVEGAGKALAVLRPSAGKAASSAKQEREVALRPGSGVRLVTPVRLQFAPPVMGPTSIRAAAILICGLSTTRWHR